MATGDGRVQPAGMCAACRRPLAAGGVHRHHDHYVEVLRDVARTLFRQRGALPEFTAWARPDVFRLESGVENPKIVAVGVNRLCMRFADPVLVCDVCNGLDGYMKQAAAGGAMRVPELLGRSEFTLRPDEIASCLAGGDGTQAAYGLPSTLAAYLEVLRTDDWDARRAVAVEGVGRTFDAAAERWRSTRRKSNATRYDR